MTRTILTVVLLAWSAAPAFAFDKVTLCLRVNVQTVDSGAYDYSGRRESYWVDADRSSPDHYFVKARGIRVSVLDPSSVFDEQFFWADPSTGCLPYQTSSANPVVSVRVYSRARDENGNIVRIHNAQDDSSSSRPGSLYYKQIDGVILEGESVTVDVDGRSAGNTKWTTMAIAAFTLHQFHAGNHDKEISIGFLPADDECFRSSSSFGDSTDYITTGRHLVRLSTCDQMQHLRKFVVSHEIGHALGRLYYGRNGFDSPKDSDYDPQPASCMSGGSYGITSTEWDSVAFPEGFAHFVSTRVWNTKSNYATINWGGTPHQAEIYDIGTFSGGAHLAGGHVQNACGVSVHGVTTNADWLRFYWDWYTSTSCGTAPNREDLLRLYKQVRENQHNGVYSPTGSSFHWGVHVALDDVAHYSECERDNARAFLDWNAAGGTSHGW